MKKIKNKKVKVPAHAFGLAGALGAGQLVGGIADIFTAGQENRFGKPSNAQIGVNTAKGAVTGAAAGASIGGPIGAGAGALVGGLTSFFGNQKRKKEALEAERRYNNLASMEEGYANTVVLQQEYDAENPLALTFANGGMMPNSLAYLDNDEVIRDVNGNIGQVPNTRPGTDNHLVDATELESVLSDKIKRPGTKKTFAQEGEKVRKIAKPSKGKDRFAEATNKLNKMNANALYEQLLNEQEEVKDKKGIKNKTKGIPAYQKGVRKNLNMYGWPQYVPADDNSVDTISGAAPDTGINTYDGGMLPEVEILASAPKISKTPKAGSSEVLNSDPVNMIGSLLPEPSLGVASTLGDIGKLGNIGGDLSAPRDFEPGDGGKSDLFAGIKNAINGINVGDISNDLLTLTPTLYNWRRSRENVEQEGPLTNPYRGAITRAMSKRRSNIRPVQEANRRTRTIGNYNAGKLNPNTGANLAYRNQMAVGEYAANADLYAQKQNIDNAYLGEYANMLAGLGQQYNQSKQIARENNSRNRAARDAYRGAAASQIGQWSQTRQQMRNQKRNDDMVYPLLENFLSQGYGNMTIDELHNKYYNKRP